jgi:chromosomal replication initiator protein
MPKTHWHADAACPTMFALRVKTSRQGFPPRRGLPLFCRQANHALAERICAGGTLTVIKRSVAALGDAIAQRIGEQRYKLWFEQRTKLTRENDQIVVGVPNRFYQDYLESKFAPAVQAAASEMYGCPMMVHFAIDAELFQAARRAETQGTGIPMTGAVPQPRVTGQRSALSDAAEEQALVLAAQRRSASPRERRWRHLKDFVVGSCNRVAHASALSVVETPGQGPNPLVLHGPVGTGKTHLLEGIYAGLRRGRPEWRVCFVTSEDFTNRFVQGMRLGQLSAFRKQFRECDALLIDDLHFLARKRATQEEFLHTFNAVCAEGRQVVATCDCHPRLVDQFLPELVDRLLGGAVWGLLPPDAATRLELLRTKSLRGDQTPLPEDVLRFLAEKLNGNVRELEGTIHSVQHYARVAERPVNLDLAREALADLLRHAMRIVQLGDIDRVVCTVLGLGHGALQVKKRGWSVAHPRMLAMYLARKHTRATYIEIGEHFGGRSHSTVVAAEKKVRQWLEAEETLALANRQVPVREVLERVERELAG